MLAIEFFRLHSPQPSNPIIYILLFAHYAIQHNLVKNGDFWNSTHNNIYSAYATLSSTRQTDPKIIEHAKKLYYDLLKDRIEHSPSENGFDAQQLIQFIQNLKNRGFKLSGSRVAVWRVLEKAKTPLSPYDIE